jgi:SAM-dependent methyltransferase
MLLFYMVVIACLFTFGYGAWRAAPWLPTRRIDADRFKKIAALQPNERFYDLGCGDGRIVAAAAQAGAHATGFELAFLPYLAAKLRTHGLANAHVRYGDFWRRELADADVVYIFLTQRIYPRLEKKLRQELKPGARVICYAWPLPTWKPETTLPATRDHLPLFLYRR